MSNVGGVNPGVRALKFCVTSPIWLAGHGCPALTLQKVWLHVPSVEVPAAKWSFSSDVNTNSVFDLLMPSAASRAKNAPKAWS